MNTTFKLSLRNLTRQKRRNAILAIAIAFGFFVVTFIDGLTSGMINNLEDMITQVAGGTVLIAGYEKQPAADENGKPLLINIVRDKEYIRNLVETNNIDYKYFSRFTQSMGQMIFNGKKFITRLQGRDFTEPELLNSFQLVEGSLDNLKNPQAMVINEKIANNLDLLVGDQVIVTTSTIYGQNTVGDFTIAAIIKGNTLVDTTQVFVNIETLNKLVEIPEGGYTTFSIILNNKKNQLKVANQIENLIREDGVNVSSRAEAVKNYPTNIDKGIDKQFIGDDLMWEGTKYGIETLNDAIPALKTVMSVVHTVATVILLVILLIVMVGVSNTYRMVLYERIREIGTMRALGMDGKTTGKVFTTEAIILCVLGACLGVVMAVVVMTIVHFIPIRNEALTFFLNKGHFSFTFSIGTVIMQYLLLIVLTSLAVRGSAKKASRMNPAEALRTVK